MYKSKVGAKKSKSTAKKGSMTMKPKMKGKK